MPEKLQISNCFKPGYRCFIGLGSEQSWNYDTIANARRKWHAIAEKVTDIFAQSGHPVFPVAAESMKKGTIKIPWREKLPFIS